MNKWIGMGRLTKDPDVRSTASGKKVARYTLAIDRARSAQTEQQADFISCVAWEKRAEFVEKYLRKGTKILVSGQITTGSYESEGRRIYTTDILIDSQEFCESKGSQQATPELPETDDFMSIPDDLDEELPFN